LRNGAAVSLGDVPDMNFDSFARWIAGSVRTGCRIAAFFAVARGRLEHRVENNGTHFLYAVLADDATGLLTVARAPVSGKYPSMARAVPALHLFERVIYEKNGILPEGHPWLKPARFENPSGPAAGDMDFYRVDGDEVHEVSVGPIHAGVIECGHFRFQCLGEEVLHLEISLGYHHRGVEKLLAGLSPARIPSLVEVTAGDSTAAHTWACCALLESLTDTPVPPRGHYIRALALELERLACHTGDVGAIAGDVGFLPTSAFCGRLRGDWLNMSAMLCGSRFSRGLLRPGGTNFDVNTILAREMAKKMETILRDVRGATHLIWDSPSVMARLTGIGALTKADAVALGLVGPASRACGLSPDARRSHPLPGLPAPPALCTADTGDVNARTKVRCDEIAASASFCLDALRDLPEGEYRFRPDADETLPLAPERLAAVLIEGWRGEVCHVALTDKGGGLAAYAVVDPSFHNWAGLALAMRGQQISDFPLCNKSFNLSYCGHDL
jgi:Ni,Fe-hydrogenase III large subunit